MGMERCVRGVVLFLMCTLLLWLWLLLLLVVVVVVRCCWLLLLLFLLLAVVVEHSLYICTRRTPQTVMVASADGSRAPLASSGSKEKMEENEVRLYVLTRVFPSRFSISSFPNHS